MIRKFRSLASWIAALDTAVTRTRAVLVTRFGTRMVLEPVFGTLAARTTSKSRMIARERRAP